MWLLEVFNGGLCSLGLYGLTSAKDGGGGEDAKHLGILYLYQNISVSV